MEKAKFVARYGGIYEHSEWVAVRAYSRLGATFSPDAVREALAACVAEADRESKLTLIRAHPDLAGKAAVQGTLTDASTAEQQSAGIDQCSPEEYARFQEFNSRYKSKFGFPFVIAVRGKGRAEILEAFELRLDNTPQAEFETALQEIHKIARLRLNQVHSEVSHG